MRKAAWCLLACIAVASTVAASEPRGALGPGEGVVAQGDEPTGCGTLVMNTDEAYENAYNWQYNGVVLPDYGAMAECYDGPVEVCSIILDATGEGFHLDRWADLYVWADNGGLPGAVVASVPHAYIGVPPVYPTFRRYVFDVPDVECLDRAWVGYWPDNPDASVLWYIGADLDGPGGCAMTNIAPGIGYPSGWQNVSVAWGPTQALGIGAEVIPCDPVPTMETTWGQVKALYR